MRLKKGDKVKIIAGKDLGKVAKVERVYSKQKKVLIEGVNLFKKHIKKSEKIPQGGVVEVPRPLDISNVLLICPKCQKATRVGLRFEKGKKYRVCKKCKKLI